MRVFFVFACLVVGKVEFLGRGFFDFVIQFILFQLSNIGIEITASTCAAAAVG